MTKDLIGYSRLAQESLREVVKKSIALAASPKGLPGSHHFYISFKTADPGCDVDESLSEAYPDEMTIVLEHQFWDLAETDDGFEVTLKFNSIPKYLKVPWRAITRFHDPSVNFQLYFDYEPPEEANGLAGKTSQKVSGDDQDEATVVSLDAFRKKE